MNTLPKYRSKLTDIDAWWPEAYQEMTAINRQLHKHIIMLNEYIDELHQELQELQEKHEK